MSQENINELNALNIARMVKDDLAGKFIVRYCMQPNHNYGESLENFDMLLTDLEENLISIQWSKRYGTVLVIVSGTPEADKFTDSDGQFEVNKHTIDDILELIKKAFPEMGILTRKDRDDFGELLIKHGDNMTPHAISTQVIYDTIDTLIELLETLPLEERQKFKMIYFAQSPNRGKLSAYFSTDPIFTTTMIETFNSHKNKQRREAENAGS